MEKLVPTPIFDFLPGQLDAVRESVGYGDVNKLKQEIDIFDDWIKKQAHFVIKEFDRAYLERFLIYNKGSIEKAKSRFDRLCTLRNLMPELLTGFDLKNEFVDIFNCTSTCILPIPTPDYYRLAVARAYGSGDGAYIIQFFRYLVLNVEYTFNHDYCVGYEFIVDTRDIEFGIVLKLNPIVIQKATTLLIEGMNQRVKAVHFISGSKFFDSVINIAKMALTEKLKSRIQIHNNVESLHQHIPRELLPEDYGGDQKSIVELVASNFQELCSDTNIKRLKYIEEARTDESRRLSCKFNEEYSGTPGSFKSLTVD